MGNLFSRIKNTINKLKPQLSTIPETIIDEEASGKAIPLQKLSYTIEANITHVIREAARHRLLVRVYYNGMWRYVEPYSFRQGKQGTLFFGHDLTRNNTRSYYVYKISELQPTDIPFSPRWLIEIN